ncbi:MAG: hypothetical protein IJX70_02245 [Clostridia bacterium]|nr:hypothetical protein [Clostridia bacterium]
MADKIAIIGKGQDTLAFKAAGVDAYTAMDSNEARTLLKRLAHDYKVIFLADVLAVDMQDLLVRMLQDPYPIVMVVPSAAGSNGLVETQLKEQSERALGMDILYNKEEK